MHCGRLRPVGDALRQVSHRDGRCEGMAHSFGIPALVSSISRDCGPTYKYTHTEKSETKTPRGGLFSVGGPVSLSQGKRGESVGKQSRTLPQTSPELLLKSIRALI